MSEQAQNQQEIVPQKEKEQEQQKQEDQQQQPQKQEEERDNNNNNIKSENDIIKEQQNLEAIKLKKELEQQNNTKLKDMNIMEYGQQVIIYIKNDQQKIVTLTKGQVEGNIYGHFKHDDMVGKQFGTKLSAQGKGGFIFALKPTASLITRSIPHKTQIIYESDCATIIFKLNILPGKKVIESGTGTGSLSNAILSVLQGTGHLYTFEFNEERQIAATQFFKECGHKNVDCIHRDATGQGFLNQEGQNFDVQNADAVFLDLPAPYKTIHHAKAVLKRGGKLCCYSPCIEQCQKNTEEIWKQGFLDVHTIEVVLRVHDRQFQEFKKAFDLDGEINVKRKLDQMYGSSGDQSEQQKSNNNKQEIHFNNKIHVASYGHTYGHTAYLTFATLP